MIIITLNLVIAGETNQTTGLAVSSSENAQLLPSSLEFWLPAPRGKIISKDGVIYAETIASVNLGLRWQNFDTDEAALTWSRQHVSDIERMMDLHLDIKDADIVSAYKFRRFEPFSIHENLTPEQKSLFQQEHLEDQGFLLMDGLRRFYPQKSKLSHTVGYIKRSQTKNSGVFRQGEVIQDKYTGGFGIEKVFDHELSGLDGRVVISTKEEQLFSRLQTVSDPKPGNTVRMTIDSAIQDAVEKAMNGVSAGAAVVMDVNSGSVVAMVSKPGFDPNEFFPRISTELWDRISSDLKVPLLNRVYATAQPPGSIFKVITSLGSMRAKVFDPEWVLDCEGKLRVGDVLYNLPAETNSVDFREALVVSCNTYFMTLGIKTGRDTLLAVAREMGIGQKTGFDLTGETSGRLPDPEFVRKTHHRLMGSGDVANTSIGQGDLLVTPLQAANWMAALANGGTLYRPHVIEAIEDDAGVALKTFPPEVIRRVEFPRADVDLLKDALKQVVQDGTGYPAQIPNFEFAGKTGTAQVGSKEKPRQVVWMNGFVPFDHPQYSFAVMMEGTALEDLHGGDHVGPIVGNIFSKVFAVKANPE